MEILKINNKNAWDTWNVRMGDSFIDAIAMFPSLKPFIENKSRLENRKRVIVNNPKIDTKEITLTFDISGLSKDDFLSHKNSFMEELLKGKIQLEVPDLKISKVLCYKNGVSYAESLTHTYCQVAIKFEEIG